MELDKHDLAKDAPSRELLERLVDENNLDAFINRRSPAYKENGLDKKKLTKKEAIDWMMKDPNLIKRPLVLKGKKAVFGYDPEAFDKIIS